MLPVDLQGESGPFFVALHWLGGGSQTWEEVGEGLARRGVRFAAIDAPGFGRAADVPAGDVTSAADSVVDTIRHLRAVATDEPWVLGGHSMGGKLAMVIARRALDGEEGLQGLRGLFLVSPSPPSPEPIEDSRREQHLKNFGETAPEPAAQRKVAEAWVDRNTGTLPLPEAVRERAVQGVLTNNPRAYRAWFLKASKEDWSERVGSLELPALLLVGTEETSLGEEKQRKLTLPHLPQGDLNVLAGMKHLAPVERPREVIELVTQFLTKAGLEMRVSTAVPSERTTALMNSQHTSPFTLEIMTDRLRKGQHWNHTATAFSPAEFRTLRALAEAVIPDAGFDLAAAIDVQLAYGQGDGWRHARLPRDLEAWHRGLFSLDLAAERQFGVAFIALYPGQQRTLLHQIATSETGRGLLGALHLGEATDAFSGDEAREWFGDVRVEFSRFYMADPRTMDRIGYTGFADDLGFTQIQLGQQEEFER